MVTKLAKVKVKSNGLEFRKSQFFLNGVEIPIMAIDIKMSTDKSFNEAEIFLPMEVFEIDTYANVKISNISLGEEAELAVLEYLESKYRK